MRAANHNRAFMPLALRRLCFFVTVVSLSITVMLSLQLRSRLLLWDEVLGKKGRIRLEVVPLLDGYVSERVAFGLGLCEVLGINVNGINNGDSLLKSVSQSNRIVEVIVSNSHVTDDGLLAIAGVPALKFVSFYGNHISDRSVSHLFRVAPGIETLNLAYTKISSEVFLEIGLLPNIKSINVEGTNICDVRTCDGNWPESLMHMNLSRTNVGNGQVNLPRGLLELLIADDGDVSKIVVQIDGLRKLRLISLSRSDLSHAPSGWLQSCQELRQLLLSGVDPCVEVLWEASSLPHLNYLDVSGCSLPPDAWSAIRSFVALRFLICRGSDLRRIDTTLPSWNSRLHTIDAVDALIDADQIRWLRTASGGAEIFGKES